MNNLEVRAQILLINTAEFIELCEQSKVTDEQWFIEFEMKMSELVTQDHNDTKNN